MPRLMYSIITPLWVCTHSILCIGEKRGVPTIVAGSMYFVGEPQKNYKEEQISTVNIRPAMDVKTFLCIFIAVFVETAPMMIFVLRSSLYIYSITAKAWIWCSK
jgi:hypothetical protein